MSHAASLRLGRAGRERHTRPAIPPTEDSNVSHPYRVGELVRFRKTTTFYLHDLIETFDAGQVVAVLATRPGAVRVMVHPGRPAWLPVPFVEPLEDQP